MIVKEIPSTWLIDAEHRLDCGPFVKGSIEARKKIEKLQGRKENLQEITLGGISGIYHVGQDKIIWTEDAENGMPFIRSGDILKNDFSDQVLISRRQVANNYLFQCPIGTTLITRSGTIGRMAFMRSDMLDTATSQDVLKVVPDPQKIKSGYLFAFLNCRFGVPIVTGGTFGSIIVHIEADNIANLPVPRLGEVENQSHELIEKAADLRVEANKMISKITQELEMEIGGCQVKWQFKNVQSYCAHEVLFNKKVERLDAFHHIGYVGEAIEKAKVPLVEVQKFARALRPPIMKRNRVQEGGFEFLGGSELLTLEQKGEDRISSRTPKIDQYIVKSGYVLFQCVGQRYGIFGTPVLANRSIIGKTVTEHVMRLIPFDPRDAGYLSIYLATNFGKRLCMRFSAGTSIPVLQEVGANKILVYWPPEDERHEISRIAEEAWEKRAMASELEDEARKLVEQAIEGGGH